ncbi:MAG: hypothetical protein AAF471_06220 [Myxococcota bacterium]
MLNLKYVGKKTVLRHWAGGTLLGVLLYVSLAGVNALSTFVADLREGSFMFLIGDTVYWLIFFALPRDPPYLARPRQQQTKACSPCKATQT